MRHRKNFNHLGRKTGHRRAMLANMASSLILHKRIQTTTAKAKALRIYVEPLITKSKDDSTHSRRTVFSHLQNKEAVTELFREVSPKIAERPGGYTRILKTGARLGDNADMCIIELVDYNENLLTAKDEAAAKSGKRRRRGGKKKSTSDAAQATDAPIAEETTTAEASVDAGSEQESLKEEASEAVVEDVKAETEEKTEVVAEEKEATVEVVEEEKKTENEEKVEAEKPEDEVKAKSEENTEDKQEEKAADKPEEKKKEE